MAEPLEVSGVVLATRGDAILYEATRGFADAERVVPCTTDTRFQLASISKQFTAAATLLQVESGTVRLDDEVGAWIEGCPPSWRGITIHRLLTHTSGLGHWPDYPELDLFAWISPSDIIKAFQQAGPRFEPGSDWYYSSPAYVLLAYVVENASGQPYHDYLQHMIFEPLGLHDTFAGMPDGQDRLATPYDEGKPTLSFELNSIGVGAGDAWSTTHDLLRWNRTLASGRFLSEPSRRLMFTPHARTGPDPLADAYGYGWYLGTIADHQVRHHAGHNAGFRAFNAWFPETDSCVIVLSNNESADAQGLATKLAEAWLRTDAVTSTVSTVS